MFVAELTPRLFYFKQHFDTEEVILLNEPKPHKQAISRYRHEDVIPSIRDTVGAVQSVRKVIFLECFYHKVFHGVIKLKTKVRSISFNYTNEKYTD